MKLERSLKGGRDSPILELVGLASSGIWEHRRKSTQGSGVEPQRSGPEDPGGWGLHTQDREWQMGDACISGGCQQVHGVLRVPCRPLMAPPTPVPVPGSLSTEAC